MTDGAEIVRVSDSNGQDVATLPDFDSFLHREYGVIGRTASTRFEPNTSSVFQFWLAMRKGAVDEGDEVAPIQIGNIVAAFADDGRDLTFGMVTEMRSYSDIDSFIADYLSHDFGDAAIEVPTDISEVVVVTCAVMRNVSHQTKPVGRSRVMFPSALGIKFAYGIVDERGVSVYRGSEIPFGIFENGDGTVASISVDEDFLIGPEGAHLNVSGISGLASKTSAIEFVTRSLLDRKSRRVAVVMFNVKSRDLLYIDRPNPVLNTDDFSKEVYEAMEVTTTPFVNASFFAPADPNGGLGATQSLRQLLTTPFQWDLSMIYEQIPALFSPMDWDDKMEGAWFVIQDEIQQGNILTYTSMLAWLDRLISSTPQTQQWPRGSHIATWNKMRSHLRRFPHTYQGLIATGGEGADIPWAELSDGNVYVIDIQMLNDRGQRLVFSRAVNELSNMLEADQLPLDGVVVFVDELNKFAPAGNVRTPLKDRLVDITARGRSVGLVLFGAEQFASSVDKEIIENSSTYLYGRTETNELRTPTFSAFSEEIKTKLTMLPQGHLLIKFAKFPQPIFLRFPHPPCLPGDKYIPQRNLADDIPF